MKKLSNFNGGRDRNRGFSLIELIIAIAILVILTGLLAPQFMKYIEKSRKAACDNNIDVILQEFQVALIDDGETDILKFVSNYIKEHNVKCPSKGEYYGEKIKGEHGDLITVRCSIHGGESISSDPTIIDAVDVYTKMYNLTALDWGELAKKIKKPGENDWISNDMIREYLGRTEFSGKWPEFDENILKANGINTPLYIQPYINMPKKENWKEDKENNIVVFATSKSSADAKKWDASLIYNPKDKKWYKRPFGSNLSVNGKNVDEILKRMEEEKWTPLS